MNRPRIALPLLLLLVAALSARDVSAQDWKGKGRLDGRVTDPDGKPVAGAVVKLRVPGKPDQGPDLKTDGNGRWAYLGLRGGEWKITIEAPGFMQGETTLSVSEVIRANPVNYAMKPVPKAQPEQPAGLAPEIVEALKAGNEALAEKRWADARAAFEKVLPVAPDNPQLLLALARSYSGEGDTEKAVEMLRRITEKEPQNWTAWLLMANMLLEKGRLEEGRAALEKVPAESITDPNVYINVGVLFMNQKKNDEAEGYFSKAIEVAPGQFDGYYFRGLARVGLHKYADARPDLQKVVELAPAESSEAKEARQLLDAIKAQK
jgi:tetratricopeptide (TPR) repeat protein